MTANQIASFLEDFTYAFLALNFIWGMFHLVVAFRRMRVLSFRNQDEQDEWIAELVGMVENRNYTAAEEMCDDDARALPQVAHMAVVNRDVGDEQLRQLVTEVVQRDLLGDFEYRTGWIATVIKSGPLLGLFGTVLGMMAAFGRIGTGEKIQPAQIADEISVALICTAMGLATAIPFNFALASLNARIRKFQDALGAGLVRIMDMLHTGR